MYPGGANYSQRVKTTGTITKFNTKINSVSPMLSQQKVQCSPVTVWVVSGLSGFIPPFVRLIGGFGHISFCVRT